MGPRSRILIILYSLSTLASICSAACSGYLDLIERKYLHFVASRPPIPSGGYKPSHQPRHIAHAAEPLARIGSNPVQSTRINGCQNGYPKWLVDRGFLTLPRKSSFILSGPVSDRCSTRKEQHPTVSASSSVFFSPPTRSANRSIKKIAAAISFVCASLESS
eukprot:SAG31_NODE_2309_length_5961_cov_3.697373_3_plen_162_part_00